MPLHFIPFIPAQTSETQELSLRTPHAAVAGKPFQPQPGEPAEGLGEGKKHKLTFNFALRNQV